MEKFSTSANSGHMRETLVIGATFGIFLTFGNAWSAFLESLAVAMMPVRDDDTEGSEIVRQLLYASLTSAISLSLLIVMIKCNNYAAILQTNINEQNMKHLTNRLRQVRIDNTAMPVRLMGNTRHSQLRRTHIWTTRTRVRQGVP